jgi:hypothetical protein
LSEWEVISQYTDTDAVEDGMLVELRSRLMFRGMPVNRLTIAVFEELKPFLRSKENPLLPTLIEVLREKLKSAGEQGGDIVKVLPHYWLLENEVRGWTLMLPSDY